MGRPLCDVIGRPGDDDPSFYFKHIPTCVIRPPQKMTDAECCARAQPFCIWYIWKSAQKNQNIKKGKSVLLLPDRRETTPGCAGATSHPSSPVTWYCHISITLYTHTRIERKRDINVPIGIPFLYSLLSCVAFSLSRRFPFRFFFLLVLPSYIFISLLLSYVGSPPTLLSVIRGIGGNEKFS